MRRTLAAAAAIAALGLVAGCFPQGQTYGVGNVGGLVFAVNPPDAEVVRLLRQRYVAVRQDVDVVTVRRAGREAGADDLGDPEHVDPSRRR